MPHFVYILKCSDGSLYVGSTTDLTLRVNPHNEGRGGAFTVCRRPVSLTYSEEHTTLASAVKRERQIKRWTRAKKQALIDARLVDLKHLSRTRQRW